MGDVIDTNQTIQKRGCFPNGHPISGNVADETGNQTSSTGGGLAATFRNLFSGQAGASTSDTQSITATGVTQDSLSNQVADLNNCTLPHGEDLDHALYVQAAHKASQFTYHDVSNTSASGKFTFNDGSPVPNCQADGSPPPAGPPAGAGAAKPGPNGIPVKLAGAACLTKNGDLTVKGTNLYYEITTQKGINPGEYIHKTLSPSSGGAFFYLKSLPGWVFTINTSGQQFVFSAWPSAKPTDKRTSPKPVSPGEQTAIQVPGYDVLLLPTYENPGKGMVIITAQFSSRIEGPAG